MTAGPLFAWYNAGTPIPTLPAFLENVSFALLPWDTANLAAAQKAGYKALAYQDTSYCSAAPQGNVYPSGVSYPEAQAYGWLLLDATTGQPFTFANLQTDWAADIGSGDYQRAWAENVLELLAGGWDGVFMDDVNPSITGHYVNSQVAKYPTDALYGAAMGSFVQTVGGVIQEAGKLAVGNVSQTVKFASVVTPWFSLLSGWMDEQLSPGRLFVVEGS